MDVGVGCYGCFMMAFGGVVGVCEILRRLLDLHVSSFPDDRQHVYLHNIICL